MNKPQENSALYYLDLAEKLYPDGFEIKLGLKLRRSEYFGGGLTETVEIKPKTKRQSLNE
jgi:hypothetical protein